VVPVTDAPLGPAATLRDAVRAIEATRRRIAVVADADGRLAGTLTDGDVRRALLAGLALDAPAAEAMNRQPIAAHADSEDAYLLEMLRHRGLESMPLVDRAGRYVRTVHVSDLDDAPRTDGAAGVAAAVLMAGGEGRRLRPITETIPKPLVEVGGVPVIERLLRSLVRAEVRRVWVATNYLSHLIEARLGDGAAFGAEVRYVREERKMGTAGALSLLPERPDGPVLVMNGDVVTRCSYGNLLRFHREHGAPLTVAAVEHRVRIPYGVLRTDGPLLTAIEEKPSQRFLCNAGIYMLEPDAIGLVPADRPSDMTDLMARCVEGGAPPAVFPIHEYWADIGTPEDLAEAHRALGAMEAEDA